MVKSCLLLEASLHGASARLSGWLGDARPPKDFFLLRNFVLFTKTTNSNHRQFDSSSPTQLATPNVVDITTPLFKTVITRVPHGGFHDAMTT